MSCRRQLLSRHMMARMKLPTTAKVQRAGPNREMAGRRPVVVALSGGRYLLGGLLHVPRKW